MKPCRFKIGDYVTWSYCVTWGYDTNLRVIEVNRCMGKSLPTEMGAIPNADYFMVTVKEDGIGGKTGKLYCFDLEFDEYKMKQIKRENVLNTL